MMIKNSTQAVLKSVLCFLTLVMVGCATSDDSQGRYPFIESVSPHRFESKAGTTITIRFDSGFLSGYGAEPGVEVKIGSKKCEKIERVNAGLVRCVTPELDEFGSQTLEVTNPKGDGYGRSSSQTVYVKPSLKVTRISPETSTRIGSEQIRLYGQGFTRTTRVWIGGRECTGVTPEYYTATGYSWVDSAGYWEYKYNYTQIQCHTPAFANSDVFDVVIGESFSDGITLTSAFRYNEFDREGYNARGRDREGFNRQGRDAQNRYRYEVVIPRLFADGLPDQMQFIRAFEVDRRVIHDLEGPGNGLHAYYDSIAAELGGRLDVFFDRIQPTFDGAMALLSQSGGVATPVQVDLTMRIKREIFEHNLVRNTQDFVDLMGTIFPNPRRNGYHRLNADLLEIKLNEYLLKDELKLKDLRILKVFAENVVLDVEARRPGLVQAIEEKRLEMVGNLPDQVIANLTVKVRALLQEKLARNEIDLAASPVKFYLVRANDLEGVGQEIAHDDFECAICVEDFVAGTPFFHARGQVCTNCVYAYNRIKGEIENRRFPVRIPGSDVELALTPLKMSQFQKMDEHGNVILGEDGLPIAGFTREEIQNWQIRTLVAYYKELKGVADGTVLFRDCPNDHCKNVIFHDDLSEDHQFECESCGESYCFDCRRSSHAGRGCQERMPPPDSTLRPCPYCFETFEKDNACNSVTCRNCGRLWNFVKGKVRARTTAYHDFNTNGPDGRPILPPRLYRVPGDPDYVAGQDMESAFPAAEGAFKERE